MSLVFSSRRIGGILSTNLRSVVVSVRFISDGPRRSPLSPEKTQLVRDWAESFKSKELNKELAGIDVRFDRSGGAGGQVSSSGAIKAWEREGEEGRRNSS